jgi:hypothetical protein
MGGKNDSPDYEGAALAQGEANEGVVRDQTYANRPTQYTPWGYTSWEPSEYTDPGSNEQTTRWQQTQGLTPELQDILNKQIAIQGGRSDIAGMLTGRLGNEFGTPMDYRGMTPMGQVPNSQFTLPEPTQRSLDYSHAPELGDPRAMRQRAEDNVYRQAQSRLGPQYETKRDEMEIKLRNQGIGPEDEAWKAQMGAIGQQETDAYGQAQMNAINQGQSEQNQTFNQNMGARGMATGEADRLGQFANQANNQAYNQAYGANQANYGQAMQGSNYANQIRQQQMTEAMQQRGFSLNEINALISGQQVNAPQMPSFSNASAAQPAPVYQAGVDQGNFDQAGDMTGDLIGAAGTIGGAMMMSDRRMKTNINRIGTRQGYPWYSYNLKTNGSAQEGVMADEIPQKYVHDIGGVSVVDYGRLFGE